MKAILAIALALGLVACVTDRTIPPDGDRGKIGQPRDQGDWRDRSPDSGDARDDGINRW